jgi:DNA-binding transcriptional regulator YiaG
MMTVRFPNGQAVQHWEQGRRVVAGAAEKLMECLGRKGS